MFPGRPCTGRPGKRLAPSDQPASAQLNAKREDLTSVTCVNVVLWTVRVQWPHPAAALVAPRSRAGSTQFPFRGAVAARAYSGQERARASGSSWLTARRARDVTTFQQPGAGKPRGTSNCASVRTTPWSVSTSTGRQTDPRQCRVQGKESIFGGFRFDSIRAPHRRLMWQPWMMRPCASQMLTASTLLSRFASIFSRAG
jgi:hypothetical protein